MRPPASKHQGQSRNNGKEGKHSNLNRFPRKPVIFPFLVPGRFDGLPETFWRFDGNKQVF
jgi:hypothetical protein